MSGYWFANSHVVLPYRRDVRVSLGCRNIELQNNSGKEMDVMRTQVFCIALLAGWTTTGLIQAADKPDLNGKWELDSSRSELHMAVPPGLSWQIEQKDDSIHVIEHAGDKNVAEFACSTDGKGCKVKDSGHAAEASFYYNGPVLVELETSGRNRDNVVKKRIHLTGDVLTIDVMHIMPAGKDEKLVMTRKTSNQMASLPASASK